MTLQLAALGAFAAADCAHAPSIVITALVAGTFSGWTAGSAGAGNACCCAGADAAGAADCGRCGAGAAAGAAGRAVGCGFCAHAIMLNPITATTQKQRRIMPPGSQPR